MKKILFTVVILAVAVGVLPKFIGSIVEEQHNAFVEKLAQDESVVVSTKSFERNWFSGKAVSEMTITLPDEVLGTITVIVEETLLFGPVLFSEEGLDFALGHATAKINVKEFLLDDEVIDYINDKVKITALLTFSTDIIVRLNVDEISKEVDGNSLFSEKASGTFKIKNENQLIADFNWGGLKIKDNTSIISVGAVNVKAEQELLYGNIYSGGGLTVGDVEFNVAEISVKDTAENILGDVKNLGFSAKTTKNNDLLNAQFAYSADEFTSVGQVFKNAKVVLDLDNFDIKTVQALNELAAAAPAQVDEAFIAENQAAALALLSQLLQKNPVVKMSDLSVDTEQGQIKSVAEFTLDKDLFDANNPMSVMVALSATANGQAPEAFLTTLGVAPMADMYVQQGLLEKKEGNLIFDLGYSGGQLSINGKPMPMM